MSTGKRKQFTLRPMEVEDIDRIADWFRDFADVALYERPLPVPVDQNAVRKRWSTLLEQAEPPTSLIYIADSEEGGPAGLCGLENINYLHGDAVVPMFVGKSVRGQGLAQAMAVEIIDLAFGSVRLNRLTTYFREDNVKTRQIVENLGFQQEGCLRQAWFAKGSFMDLIQVGLLKDDWSATQDAVRSRLSEGSVSVALSGAA